MGEKLYTRCPKCGGKGDKWQVDIQNLERAARQIRTDCPMCDGEGYMEAGIHTGQVDTLVARKNNVEMLVHEKLGECRLKQITLLGNTAVRDWKMQLQYWLGMREAMEAVQQELRKPLAPSSLAEDLRRRM